MRHLALMLVFVSCPVFVSGCGETHPAPATASPTSSTAASAAPAAVDWCKEHGVPESACTRCDAKLIPAFKATKDWCNEHALPESQCLKCNPNLKITPPAGAAK